MNSKQIRRKVKGKAPKTWQKIANKWDYKMTHDVMRFIMDLQVHIHWKEKKYDTLEIEEKVWKLLTKVRRLK
jgi:prolyl oligopeptidase PreP (S9A serine peptidase family)